MNVIDNPEVEFVFNKYPALARKKLLSLREVIIETARNIDGLYELEETLKWGEPSYLTKGGSTIRIGWKSKKPDQYAIYFQCSSRLVPTFKMVYKDIFEFEGKRAILFPLDEPINIKAVKKCVEAALTYHKVKQLPTLGI